MTNADRIAVVCWTCLGIVAGCNVGGAAMDGGLADGGSAFDGNTHRPDGTGPVVDTSPQPDGSGHRPDVGPFPDTGTTTGRTVPVGHCGAQHGLYFPEQTWIYTDIHGAPTRSNSAATTAWLASHGGWGPGGSNFQIDTSFYVMNVDASTPTYTNVASDPISYASPDCDDAVHFPIPSTGHIEGYPDYVCPGRTSGNPADDCHLISVDFTAHTLFEAYQATLTGGQFYSSCNVAWNMTHDSWGANPLAPGMAVPPPSTLNWGIGQGCTGPDAAGFPIAPLLVTVGDVMSGRVEHAIRFTLPNPRIQQSATAGGPQPTWVWPATHAGGPTATDPNAPIYGGRWRLHDPFDAAAHGLDPTNPVVRAVVYGLQHYGMVLADGGTIPIMFEDASDCGTTWDTLWGSAGSHVLYGIGPADFDVLDTGGSGAGYNCVRNASR